MWQSGVVSGSSVFFWERILVVNLFGNLKYGEIWRVNIFLKR